MKQVLKRECQAARQTKGRGILSRRLNRQPCATEFIGVRGVIRKQPRICIKNLGRGVFASAAA